MAFVRVDKSPRGAFIDGATEIRMGAHLQSKKGTSRGVYFSMSESVIDQVGWTKCKPDQSGSRMACYIELQEGVGEDAGFLLMNETEVGRGYACGTTTDGARSFSMSVSMVKLKHYALNEVPVPSEPVEFTVDEKDKTILVQCPEWLRYDPTTYIEPKPVVEQRQSHPTKAVAPSGGGKSADNRPTLRLNPSRKERRAAVHHTTRSMQ